jgi:hypothetical protein
MCTKSIVKGSILPNRVVAENSKTTTQESVDTYTLPKPSGPYGPGEELFVIIFYKPTLGL